MYHLMIFSFAIVFSNITFADNNFANDAAGIRDALSKQKPAPSLTRSFAPKKTVKQRSLKRVKLEQVNSTTGSESELYLPEVVSAVNLKIEFDVNSDQLSTESFALLNELGKVLTSNDFQNSAFLVGGHTDSDGTDEYNIGLSYRRALAVKNYLLSSFYIASERLRVVGYGEGTPIVSNTSAANKQLNRRVEIAKIR